jgi:hypothetical protein
VLWVQPTLFVARTAVGMTITDKDELGAPIHAPGGATCLKQSNDEEGRRAWDHITGVDGCGTLDSDSDGDNDSDDDWVSPGICRCGCCDNGCGTQGASPAAALLQALIWGAWGARRGGTSRGQVPPPVQAGHSMAITL